MTGTGDVAGIARVARSYGAAVQDFRFRNRAKYLKPMPFVLAP